jgi:hypothetical protein
MLFTSGGIDGLTYCAISHLYLYWLEDIRNRDDPRSILVKFRKDDDDDGLPDVDVSWIFNCA